MQRSFLQNLIFLVFLNFLVKPVWIFFIDRTVQNRVGAEEYGLYFSLFNFAFLFHIILDFGLNNFNNRAIAQDPSQANRYIPNILTLKAFLTFLYLSVSFLIAISIGFDERQLYLLAWVAANQVLISFLLYFRSNISAFHAFKTDSVISVTDRLLLIFGVGILLFAPAFPDIRIEWFIYAQTIGYALTAIIALIAARRLSGPWEWRIDSDLIRSLLKEAYPFALLGVLMSVYYRIDGVMIERLLPERGEGEAGVYAASYRLLDAINMVGYLFATLLLPIFSRMLSKNEAISDLAKTGLFTIMAIIGAISISSVFSAGPIMHSLYPATEDNWILVFQILIGSSVLIAINYIYGTLLTAGGKLKSLNRMAMGGVALNILLNAWMIPRHGAVGAAWATLITQFMLTVWQWILAHRYFDLDNGWQHLARVIIYLILCAVAARMIMVIDGRWLVLFLSTATLCVVIAVLSGLIKPAEWLSILRQRQQQ